MPRDDAAGSTRRPPTVLLAIAGVALLARIGTGIHEATRPPGPSLVRWVDVDSAAARAAAEGKPLLYDFSAHWCRPCTQMEREVFADAQAAEFINRTFIAARITDDDDRQAARALRSAHDVHEIPLLVVVRGDKNQRQEGYRNKTLTVRFLERAAAPPPGP
jgi:thiol:disulfide interchange protein